MRVFNLTTDPFPDDAGFYFDTPALGALQGTLMRVVDDGDVLLLDDPGSGKSTALERFAAAAAGRMRVFFVRAHASHDARALSNALVAALGLPPREPVAAELRDADAFFELLTGRDQVAVIVVDDAGRLERGALEQLLYLVRRWQRYKVRFVIAARPEFCERLEGLDAAKPLLGRATRLAVPRFDNEEIGDYLNLCLYRAGLVGDSPFDAERVSRVALHARGLVGAVNPLAREILGEAMREGTRGERRRHESGRRWPLAIAAAGVMSVLAVLAVPWQTPPGATRGQASRATSSLESPQPGGVSSGAGTAEFRSSIAARRQQVDGGSRQRSAAGMAVGIP